MHHFIQKPRSVLGARFSGVCGVESNRELAGAKMMGIAMNSRCSTNWGIFRIFLLCSSHMAINPPTHLSIQILFAIEQRFNSHLEQARYRDSIVYAVGTENGIGIAVCIHRNSILVSGTCSHLGKSRCSPR